MSVRRDSTGGPVQPGRAPQSAGAVKLLDFKSIGWVFLLSVLLMITFAWQLVWPVITRSRQLNAVATGAPATNGFDLATCLVPRDQIIRCVPRDHIPALSNPPTLAGDQLDAFNAVQRQKYERKFVVSGDRVIGVTIGGESRAYPLIVLNWHEMVNDTLGGTSICVTYNPLGDSAVVFSRASAGGALQFGVSGLLYNSNLLLYDVVPSGQTASLYSQLQFRAISGPAAARSAQLTVLPAELTQWADWYARHPQSSVVLGDEKLLDRYNANPYSNYFEAGRPRFPATPPPPPTGPAGFARVLALQTQDGWRVYTYDEIVSHLDAAGVWRDVNLSFHYVPVSPALDPACIWVESAPAGGQYPLVYSLWFTWYAAHPDTMPVSP